MYISDVKNNGGNYHDIAWALYVMNRTERNAHIAQLRQELISMSDEIHSDKDAYEMIKKTVSWEQFMELKKTIDRVLTETDDKVKKEYLGAVNKAMGKNFTNYEQVKKYMYGRFEKWKKSYMVTAAKIAHDVYESNPNNLWLDWGLMDKDTK